jgi:hypothetical protein
MFLCNCRAARGSGATDCYVAFVPGQLENMLTAIAEHSSMTMYGIQRPDAKVTAVPHSGHTKVVWRNSVPRANAISQQPRIAVLPV